MHFHIPLADNRFCDRKEIDACMRAEGHEKEILVELSGTSLPFAALAESSSSSDDFAGSCGVFPSCMSLLNSHGAACFVAVGANVNCRFFGGGSCKT